MGPFNYNNSCSSGIRCCLFSSSFSFSKIHRSTNNKRRRIVDDDVHILSLHFYNYLPCFLLCCCFRSEQQTNAFSMISWDHLRLQTFRSNTRAHVHVFSSPTSAEARPPTNVHSSNGGELPLLLLRTVFSSSEIHFTEKSQFSVKLRDFCAKPKVHVIQQQHFEQEKSFSTFRMFVVVVVVVLSFIVAIKFCNFSFTYKNK